MIEGLPAAWRTELLFVATVKRWLQSDELSAADRLAYLEWLASHDKAPITQDVVATTAPASDAAMEIVAEAVRISAEDNGRAMFKVLEHPDVAATLVASTRSAEGRDPLGVGSVVG